MAKNTEKIVYNIKAKDKKNKVIASETVTGYKEMRKERGAIKRTKLRKKWYRMEIKEEGKKAVAKSAPAAKYTVRKNVTESTAKGYTVYSVYKGDSKSPYDGGLYRKKSTADARANDLRHAAKQNLKQHLF